MSSKFYLYAPQVHIGGGKTLLKGLIKNPPKNIICNLIIDKRLDTTDIDLRGWDVKTINPSFIHRLIFEKWLTKNVNNGDTILFFANLPPLFKMPGFIILFIQNRYLIDDKGIQGFPLFVKTKIKNQRILLKVNLKFVSQIIVQTATMARILKKRISPSIELKICPMLDMELNDRVFIGSHESNLDVDFIYVASGEPHKNHIKLLEAWEILAQESITPTLHITVDTNLWQTLDSYLNKLVKKNKINILNHGHISHKRIIELYASADALIYPSLFESFGIPLLEASEFRLPIISSELDYVRDLIEPVEAFDPNSAISISRAVKRFLKEENKMQTIRSSQEFLDEIIKYNPKKIH